MILGITGHARHGKDTTADMICDLADYRKTAFADRMKRVCAIIFGWGERELYGDLKDVVDPRWGISPRHALQTIGTQWGQFELGKYDAFGRTTGRLLWTRSTLDDILPDEDVVIADVRFPHEAEAIRERGGKIVMIRRPGYPVDLSHESEKAIEEIKPDHVIRNGGSFDYLRAQIIDFLTSLG